MANIFHKLGDLWDWHSEEILVSLAIATLIGSLFVTGVVGWALTFLSILYITSVVLDNMETNAWIRYAEARDNQTREGVE